VRCVECESRKKPRLASISSQTRSRRSYLSRRWASSKSTPGTRLPMMLSDRTGSSGTSIPAHRLSGSTSSPPPRSCAASSRHWVCLVGQGDRRARSARRRADQAAAGLVRMSRIRPWRQRGHRTNRPDLHHDVRQAGTRAKDPDRLPTEQPYQHLGMRLLTACATGSDGLDAARLASTQGWARALDPHHYPEAAPPRPSRPVGRILEIQAATEAGLDHGTRPTLTYLSR
jgi:hypothetical protein